MAKQANRMVIGGFVVLSVIILAVSLVIFGSGKFFQKTDKYVLYFDGSIRGLNVGAPVLFQGVQVGSVVSVVIRADRSKMEIEIPVVVEISPDRFEIVGNQKLDPDPQNRLSRLIDAGMRAVLTNQSLITGQLMIELDFYPRTSVNLRNANIEYPEIPTIPSPSERLAKTFENLDLEEIQKSIVRTLEGIDHLINNPDLKTSLSEMEGLFIDTRRLIGDLHGRVGPLTDELGTTLREVDELANHLDGKMATLSANMDQTIKDYGQLARNTDLHLASLTDSIDQTLSAIQDISSEDAVFMVELKTTLQEVSKMARAFEQFADYLERHPEALLQGKDSE